MRTRDEIARALALTVAVAILIAPAIYLSAAARPEAESTVSVAGAYARAVYARDFPEAYRYLSASDRDVWDQAAYLNSQKAYRGFALQIARELMSYGTIRELEQTKSDRGAQLTIAYALPSLEDVGALVFDWDEEKLNMLSAAERQRLLEALRERARAGKLIMVQGHQSFDLIKETNGWKMFFDWADGLRIKLKAAASASLEVRIAEPEIVAHSTEPFQVNLVIRNRSRKALTFTVTHHIAPVELIDDIEMIECGLSRPLTLDPGAQREFTMAYLFDESMQHKTTALELIYILQTISDAK